MSSSPRWPGTMATGIGKVPALLARLVTSGPGPSLRGAGGQHQDADIGVLVDQLDDLLGRVALADHPVGRDAGDFLGARGELVERRIGRFRPLRPS